MIDVLGGSYKTQKTLVRSINCQCVFLTVASDGDGWFTVVWPPFIILRIVAIRYLDD